MNSAERPRLKVVYLLGTSRSGSTVLDSILGTAGSVLSMGEFGHIFWAFNPEEDPVLWQCSCGLRASECPVWSEVWSDLGARYNLAALERATLRFEEPGRSTWAPAFGRLFWTRAFREHLDALAYSVRLAARSGQVRTLVDSTKSPGRAWLYSLLPQTEFDVRFVHLVRDGRSVVSSMMTRSAPHKLDSGPSPWRSPASAIFATFYWVYVNACASLLGALNRSRYRLVRYEDLVVSPAEVLESLESFLGVDLTEARKRIAAGERLAEGHQLCGNRSKGAPVLKVKSREMAVDLPPRSATRIFFMLGGWLQWIYQRSPGSGSPYAPVVLTESYPGARRDR